jgi:C-terminal processing protease CtpA/Prc
MRIFATALLLIVSRSVFGAEVPSEQDRLIATGRLWVTVKYFHPYLAYRKDIDWDKALVEALPKIRAAHTEAEYSTAVHAMLDRLGDQKLEQKSPSHRTWIHYGPNRSAFAVEPGPSRESIAIDMGGGLRVQVMLSEPLSAGAVAYPEPPVDRAYPEAPYPSTEYRILAAYRLWGAMRNFFAYRDLMDDDWDQDFSEFLPKLIAAKDAREYNLAVAEAVTHLDDSNTEVASHEMDEYFGLAAPGLRLRLVEKKPLITQILDDAASSAGVHIGDIVTRVDGEEIVARINREAAVIPASTQQALGDDVTRRILNGPEGSEAALIIRTHDGATKEIRLKRTVSHQDQPRQSEAIKLLSSRIGYVDLGGISESQIGALFEKFAGTAAIIFDARGPLHFDPSLLASRLTDKPDVAVAIITGPISLRPDVTSRRSLTETASFFRVEAVPPSRLPIYPGKTAMLIDERTKGAAEHLGLLLEAANKTAFIGSLSAGADSEIASVVLPGGITIRYSDCDIRHGNSGKLQRVGLEPTLAVSPSLADVRAGRDVVLEKAVEYLSH